MSTIILYSRASTKDQIHTLDLQRKRLEAFLSYAQATQPDLVPVHLADSGVSSGIPLRDRPEGAKAVKLLASPDCIGIASTDLDRLFRDTRETLDLAAEWEKAGKKLYILQLGMEPLDKSSPMGTMFLTLMAAFATFEKAKIQERTRNNLRSLKQRGKVYNGTAAVGFKHHKGKVLPCPLERSTVALAASLRASGYSWQGVAEQLAIQGHTNRGKAFTKQSAQRWGLSAPGLDL